MASVIAPPKPRRPRPGTSGPPGGRSGGGWGQGRPGGGGGGGPDDESLARLRYKTGVWLALAAVVMLFAAFTSAYVVRKGISLDWRPSALPSILWLNTAVLVASSVTFERARRERECSLAWLSATAALGLVFLAGQYTAWVQLRARGVYLASNPSSSFFYLLTGAHGLHLLGGIVALLYVVWRAWRSRNPERFWRTRQAAIESTAIYWHFMDGLWVYLILLLSVGR
jgi:cytochrome c oxidase subunit 3